MKNLMLILLAIFTIATVSVSAKAPAKAKKTDGKVMLLMDAIQGKTTSAEEFKKMVEIGQPVVFVTGKGKSAKVHFVVNSDGSYGGKKLSNYYGKEKVTISGKKETRNGLSVIYADTIN